MEIREKLKKIKKQRAVFIIVTLILFIGTATFLINDVPNFIKQSFMLDTSSEVFFWIYFLLVLIEIVCGIIGSYLLIIEDKESLFIKIALILGLFYFKIANIQLSMLLFTFGITFTIDKYSIGINIVGGLLLCWYCILHLQKNIYEKLD